MRRIDEEALAEAYNRGLACEKAGDIDGAARAYAQVLRIDPDDRGGAAVRLAAMGRAPAPDRAPEAYVETLFDQHAEAFDAILVDQLGYRTPEDLRAALAGRGPFARLLDLGCGTGLTGAALADMTAHRTGVDISEGMVAIAHEKDLYDDLYVGEITAFLDGAAEDGETWDLIAATDVLPYLGEIGPLFAAAAGRLERGGLFAFSTESAPDAAFAGRGYMVGPLNRFAHAEDYLRAALTAAGLAALSFTAIVVRHDEGAPVPGQLVLARKT